MWTVLQTWSISPTLKYSGIKNVVALVYPPGCNSNVMNVGVLLVFIFCYLNCSVFKLCFSAWLVPCSLNLLQSWRSCVLFKSFTHLNTTIPSAFVHFIVHVHIITTSTVVRYQCGYYSWLSIRGQSGCRVVGLLVACMNSRGRWRSQARKITWSIFTEVSSRWGEVTALSHRCSVSCWC